MVSGKWHQLTRVKIAESKTVATAFEALKHRKLFLHIFVRMHNRLKHELHALISGKSQVRFGAIIQTIASYLNNGTKTGSAVENAKQIREQETKKLEVFISENDLWLNAIDFSQYVSEGAEQRVFLNDSEHVLKLNDAIYYNSWEDYFHNLLHQLRRICTAKQPQIQRCRSSKLNISSQKKLRSCNSAAFTIKNSNPPFFLGRRNLSRMPTS